MLDDLHDHQPILAKRGPRITPEERIQILETLNARFELIERIAQNERQYTVEPVHNAKDLLLLCLRHLGHRARSAQAQDVLQDYYAKRYFPLLDSFDPYPAELICWQSVLVTARKLGQAGERIRVVAGSAQAPGNPLTVKIGASDCPKCAARPESERIAEKCKHQTITIELILATSPVGAVESTREGVVDALTASAEANQVVVASLLDRTGIGAVGDFAMVGLRLGGPERPKGYEWNLFRALFFLDLKRYCWARARRIGRQPPMISLTGMDRTGDGAVEWDVSDSQPSQEEAAVRASIRGLLRECLAGLKKKNHLAVTIGHYILYSGLKDMVGAVPPKGVKETPETLKGLEDLLRGIPPDVPKLDEEEQDRRENVLRQWLFQARRRLEACLAAKGVSTVAGIY